jgi:hypothetical protein
MKSQWGVKRTAAEAKNRGRKKAAQVKGINAMAQIRQVRMFARPAGLYEHDRWAETIIGRIIAPAVQQFEGSLDWYWFTRYLAGADEAAEDCDLAAIPANFMHPEAGYYRSIRFRYSVSDEARGDFEERCRALIGEADCAISGFLDYPILDDLGGERHVEEPRTPERRKRRARLVAEHYCSVAKLILDSLKGPDEDGRYHLPHHEHFSGESPFQAFHHIFCNATDVPLYVRVIEQIPGDPTRPPQLREVQHRVRF